MSERVWEHLADATRPQMGIHGGNGGRWRGRAGWVTVAGLMLVGMVAAAALPLRAFAHMPASGDDASDDSSYVSHDDSYDDSYEGAGDAGPQESSVGDTARKVFDAAVLRPLGFVQTVASAVVFVPLYPLALLTGSVDELVQICITQPVDQTFRKPLGNL